MSVRQINTANYDYAMMLEVINKSYKGKADITISEYDTTAAPSVQIGSVWEDNGAIFILETDDMTPTGYAGISSSTTFYLYYDESAEVFIYSETAPTWSDALQGWYNGNGNDRAFFSMYKDSGDMLYEDKAELANKSTNQLDNLTVQDELDVVDKITYSRRLITSTNYYEASSATENSIFDALKSFIPNVGDKMPVYGGFGAGYGISFVERHAANTIILHSITGGGSLSSIDLVDGSSDNVGGITIAW